MNINKKAAAILLSLVMAFSAVSTAAAAVPENTTQEATQSGTEIVAQTEEQGTTDCITAATEPSEAVISAEAKQNSDVQDSSATIQAGLTGDLNGDKKFNLQDVMMLQKYLNDDITLTSAQLNAANLGGVHITTAKIMELQKTLIEKNENSYTYVSVSSVSLSSSLITLEIGETYSLQSTLSPADATFKTVNYSSSNTSVATVTQEGIITAKTAGTTVITAVALGGKKSTCTVNVNAPASELKLTGFTSMQNDTVTAGLFHTLTGYVKSNYPITSVRCVIEGTDMDKTVKLSASSNTTSYNVYNEFDDLMAFSEAGVGTHYFKIYATDTVKTSSTLLLSYKYTVKTNAPSSNLKSYSYGGTTYYVPMGYSSSYLYDQCDYGKFYWGGSNVGCSATAEAIGASILYGEKIEPDDSRIIWTSGGAGWGLASVRVYNCSLQTKLKQAYDELMEGKPSIINTLSSSDHWITIVGIKQGASRSSLSASDFLIANPWGGVITNMSTYLNSTGRYIPSDYSLRCYE